MYLSGRVRQQIKKQGHTEDRCSGLVAPCGCGGLILLASVLFIRLEDYADAVSKARQCARIARHGSGDLLLGSDTGNI